MTLGYCVNNLCSGLAESAFYGGLSLSANLSRLNDGLIGQVVGAGPSTTFALAVDLGSARSVSLAGVLNHNMSSMSSPAVEVLASSDQTFASDVVVAKAASSVPAGQSLGNDIVLQFPAVSRRYWLIKVTCAASSTLTLGEIFLGSAVTSLSRGSSYGSGESVSIPTATLDMSSGASRAVALGVMTPARLYSFADWTESELLELRELWLATSGAVYPLLWIDSVNPTALAASPADCRGLFGRLDLTSFAWVQDDYGVFQPPSLTITSLGRGVSQ